MKTIKYKNLEWYVIKEDNKERVLLLKDSFTNEQIQKYFTNEHMVDDDFDVKFNYDGTNLWWRDSCIRMILNSKFLEDLNINDLNIMKTTVELNEEKVVTKDYARLLTKEEVENLNINILKTERIYGYWTMSPYNWDGSYSRVFFVSGSDNPGYLYYNNVVAAYGVRPVVSLKSDAIISEETLDENASLKDAIRFINSRCINND